MVREPSRVVILVILVVLCAACGETEPQTSGVSPSPPAVPIDVLDVASPTLEATPEPDPYIDLPPRLAASGGVSLVQTEEPPLLSQQHAMQAVADLGVPWGLGGIWEGQIVTVTAYYGLATFGAQAANGEWVGNRNIPLPTGEVLDHIEDRPLWILDYGNTVVYGSGCPDCPPDVSNHSVYAVDAATGAVLFVWGYSDGADSVDTTPTAAVTPTLSAEEVKTTEQAGLPTMPPPATPAPSDPYHVVVAADYVPTPPTAQNLVTWYDLIVIGTVVEVLPAQWTTPDGSRPANPHETPFTIITPAVVELDAPPLVNRLDADFSSGRIVVATEGGQVGEDSVEFERPLHTGSRVLVGLSAIDASQPDDEQVVMTSAGPAWRAGTRYVLTADGMAVSSITTWGSQRAADLIEEIKDAAEDVATPTS